MTTIAGNPPADAAGDSAGVNKARPQRYLLPLLLPAVILLAFLSIYPFAWLIYMSFHHVTLAPGVPSDFVGTTNWREVFKDPQFGHGWVLLAKYSIASLVLEVGLGTVLAILLNNSRHQKILITLFIMPLMFAPVVAGLLWLYLYNGTFGWYYWILQTLGLVHGTILGSTSKALWAVVAVDVWEWTPLVALIVLAGLKLVPRDQLEANWVDGAGPLRSFVQVVLPSIKGMLLIAVLLRFMDNVRIIDHFIVLTGGGPANTTKILPLYLYEKAFTFFDLGQGSVIALTLLLVTILVGKLMVNRFEKNEVGPAKAVAPEKDEEVV